MAAITGTAGKDFIHETGDGLAAPAGFHEIGSASQVNDIIWAGAGDDIVVSGDGSDFVDGGAGNDILQGGLVGDAQIGGDDTLLGGDGDDTLIGGAGADNLIGGAGIDTASYAESLDRVTVFVGFGAGGGDAQGDMIADDIENLTGSGFDDHLEGNASGNVLLGLAGADALGGGNGADLLDGGLGNDRLFADSGDDILRGGPGADTLAGSDGTDLVTYFGTAIGVKVNLEAGTGSDGEAQGDTYGDIENVNGGKGGDFIIGNAGANVLNGFEGSDVLNGGAGRDTLIGGTAGDVFAVVAVGDSAVGANADRITDFSHAQGDKIDLAGIDANSALAGNQAFSFIGTQLYHHIAGELRFAQSGGVTTIAGDVNGDGASDFHIVLTGAVALTAGDFVL
jgi:Ca2+-binding RTX toxin-like protein